MPLPKTSEVSLLHVDLRAAVELLKRPQRLFDPLPDLFFLCRCGAKALPIALCNGVGVVRDHPVRCLIDELERVGGRYGMQTMCEGGGMANATIIERLS